MKKVYNIFFSIVLLTSTIFMFSACGSDEKDITSFEAQEYKVEIIYSGDKDNYFKQASIGGGGFNSSETSLIDDLTGKTLPASHLTDNNYIFSDLNRFGLSKKVQYLYLLVSASNSNSKAGSLTITVKVYRNGKLIDTIEDTAESTGKTQISINKEYFEKDF